MRRLALAVRLSVAAVSGQACGPSAGSSGPASTGSGANSTSTSGPGASQTSMPPSSEDGSSTVSEPTYDPQPCEPNLEPESPFYPLCPDAWQSAPDTFVKCTPDAVCDSSLCDIEHCGECGHRCLGACINASCPSTYSACVKPDEGLATCAEACARDGARCEDRSVLDEGEIGCTRGYIWVADPADEVFFKCPSGGSGTYQPAACDEAIQWDLGTPDAPQEGVACCCRGDLP